ncbi:MAG: adenylyltransferase/cytidyltransferase family protein [Candidatus Paceibacterota bacterium]
MAKVADTFSDSCCGLKERLVESEEELLHLSETLKELGFIVVVTGGVFDLIHIGHSSYLAEAKKSSGNPEKTKLIVFVDSDELTKKRKGEGRPIVPQDERLKMLAHLRPVDFLFVRNAVFSDDGYESDLLSKVRPHILITSETTRDFSEDDKRKLEESGVCGKVITLPPQAQTSTTERIRKLQADGGAELSKLIEETIANYLKRGEKK